MVHTRFAFVVLLLHVVLLSLTIINSTLADRSNSSDLVIQCGGSSFAAEYYQYMSTLHQNEKPQDLGFLYKEATGYTMDYKETNSVDGINEVALGIFAWGGTELKHQCDSRTELTSVPVALSSIAFVYNYGGLANKLGNNALPNLVLDWSLVEGIFNGTIDNLNHSAIQQLNPAFQFASGDGYPIHPIVRSGYSGTTYMLTYALSSVSQQWNSTYGYDSAFVWPPKFKNATETNRGMLPEVCDSDSSMKIGYVSGGTLATEMLKGSLCPQVRVASFMTHNGSIMDYSYTAVNNTVNTLYQQDPQHDPRWPFITKTIASGFWPIVGFTFACIRSDYNDVATPFGKPYGFSIISFLKFTISDANQAEKEQLGFVLLPQPLRDATVAGLAKYNYQVLNVTAIAIMVVVPAALLAALCALMATLVFVTICLTRRIKSKNEEIHELEESLLRRDNEIIQYSTNQEDNILSKVLIEEKDIELHEQIGFGSFASVYKGKWLGTSVAVKSVKFVDLLENPLQDFLREASVMSTLRHPNIVQFFGCTLNPPDTLYLVTEYCENGNVYDALKTRAASLKLKHRLAFCVDAARGMLYLHRMNVLHRDLKTQNLLVDSNWKVRLCDFGLSTDGRQTFPVSVAGTIDTCAPEVLKNKKEVVYTTKADVYAFGIVAWQIFTGEDVYAGLNAFQIEEKVVNEDLRPDINHPAIPEPCKPLISRCWAADPEDRPDFKEINTLLEAIAIDYLLEDRGLG